MLKKDGLSDGLSVLPARCERHVTDNWH